jgi:hypothetical protein
LSRVLNPTVALLTFIVGVASAAVRLSDPRPPARAPEAATSSLSAAPAPPRDSREVEKYAVYSAVIKEMYLEDGIKLLVIKSEDDCKGSGDDKASGEGMDETQRELEEYTVKRTPELKRETLDDFHAQAKKCQTLSRRFEIPIKYVLVTGKEVEQLFPDNELDRAWGRFYAKYPGSSGIISFSNVGFNPEMDQAYLSTGRGCGGLCGAGYNVLLTKKRGVWKVQSQTATWVS